MPPTINTRRLRCRLHLHKWVLRRNEDGGRYHECQFCGKYDDSTVGGTGTGLAGI